MVEASQKCGREQRAPKRSEGWQRESESRTVRLMEGRVMHLPNEYE